MRQSRSNRWNRHRHHSSDGVIASSSSDSLPMDDHGQKKIEHPQSSRNTALHAGVAKPWIIQSSILMTEEFKDRVVASSLASTVTFVTLSLLILTGQGRIIYIYVSIRHVCSFQHFAFCSHPSIHNVALLFFYFLTLSSRTSYR